MGWKSSVLQCWLLFGLSTASLNFTGKWVPNYGWDIECEFETGSDDRLQSVRLFKNNRQFLMHRPELNSAFQVSDHASDEFRIRTECNLITAQKGKCSIKVEITNGRPVSKLQMTEPQKPDIYRCEISGERPFFKQDEKTFQAYLRPTPAKVTRSSPEDPKSLHLNCTSEGLPPPELVWKTVDGYKETVDFKGYRWNPDTKLFESWSTVTMPAGETVSCTPVVALNGGKVVGETGVNSAGGIYGVAVLIMTSLLIQLVSLMLV